MPARDDDEDDDRPRRRSRGDDEDDDRPRKRKKPKKKGGPPVGLFVAIFVGLLVVGGLAVGGYLLLGDKKGGGTNAGGGSGGGAGDAAPPGYTAVRDPDGGFAVALPGLANKARSTGPDGQPVDSKIKAAWLSVIDNGESSIWVRSHPLPAGYTPGTTPELMEKLLRIAEGGIDAPWNEIVSKGPVTLDGKSAFELRYRYKPDWQAAQGTGGPGGGGGADMSRREQTIVCATTDGKRVYVIKFNRRGQMADDETVKTVYASFRFI